MFRGYRRERRGLADLSDGQAGDAVSVERLVPRHCSGERKIPVEAFSLNGDKLNREEALEGHDPLYDDMVNERLTIRQQIVQPKKPGRPGARTARLTPRRWARFAGWIVRRDRCKAGVSRISCRHLERPRPRPWPPARRSRAPCTKDRSRMCWATTRRTPTAESRSLECGLL